MDNNTVEGELRMGLGRVESAIGEAADDTELKLRGKADQIIGQVQSAYGQARDVAEESIDQVDAFVTERPYLAVALGAIAGLAIGFLMGLGRPKVIVIRPAAAPRS